MKRGGKGQKPHISSTMGVVTVLTCFGYLQTVNLNETHGTSDGLSRLKNPQRGWSRHPKGPLFQFHGASAMARALRLRVLWPSVVMLGIAHWCILPRSFMFPKSHPSYTVLSKADGKCSLEPPEDFCGVEKIECYTEPLYDQFRCRWFARLCHFWVEPKSGPFAEMFRPRETCSTRLQSCMCGIWLILLLSKEGIFSSSLNSGRLKRHRKIWT